MGEVRFKVGDEAEHYCEGKMIVAGVNTTNGNLYLENKEKTVSVTVLAENVERDVKQAD